MLRRDARRRLRVYTGRHRDLNSSMITPGLVSVILPNRNHAHYLSTSLDALLAQTWTNLEILIVDDASSDNSRDVIQSYAARDPRVRPFFLSENLGVNRAVEFLRLHIRGEFLCTAAADDFVAPTFFEASVAQLMRYPAAGLCFSDPSEYYEKESRTLRFPLYLSDKPAHYNSALLRQLFARNHFHISSNTVLYRTAAFDAAGGYIDKLGWLSDWFVTFVVALRNGVCYLPEALTFLRIRDDSFSALTQKDPSLQRAPFEYFLSLLATPDYADVARAMHEGGILPEYHMRTLRWLSQSAEGRQFLTPRLVGRIVVKSTWARMRPIAPIWFRRVLRKTSSGRVAAV